MIFGVGTDLTEVRRFEKWIYDPPMIARFFNSREIQNGGTVASQCQHYAVRFAAKEAFSKALGTGICGFELKDVFIVKDQDGKPELKAEGSAAEILEKKCGKKYRIHVSLTHEKEYAVAFVIIEV
jgi:holo-[acyl-carrier protein] synthase